VRIIIATFAVASMLAGCVANPPPATDQERTDAMLALNACLEAAAKKLDDGTSEASTIALGLKTSCAAEFSRSIDAAASRLSNPAAREMFHRMDDQTFMQVATAAVLDERAKRRQHQ
jgi:hypothetical protein